jgi:hypothetical protein
MEVGGNKKKFQLILQVNGTIAKGGGTTRKTTKAVGMDGTSIIPDKAVELDGIKQILPMEVKASMEGVGGTIVRRNFGTEIMMMLSLVMLLAFLVYIMAQHLKLSFLHQPW